MDRGVAQRRISIGIERINAAAAEIARRADIDVPEIPRQFGDPVVAQVRRTEALADLLERIVQEIVGGGYEFTPGTTGARTVQAANRPAQAAPEDTTPPPAPPTPPSHPLDSTSGADSGDTGPGGQQQGNEAGGSTGGDDAATAAARAILAGNARDAIAALGDASPAVAMAAVRLEQAAESPRRTVLAKAEQVAQQGGD